MEDPTHELNQAIAEHRRQNAARRARAFVDAPDRVLGFSVQPMTLPTWTMLHAVGSRFLGTETPLEGDVRNYLWFHSRLFMPVKWYTVPTFAKWLALLPFSALLRRQKDVDFYCAAVALAGTDIMGIIAEVFADAPTGSRKDGSPAQGCLEAQLIHLFVREYKWTPGYIRKQPLAQLIQLARQFSTETDDDAERNIRFAHLRKWNDILQAENAKKETA